MYQASHEECWEEVIEEDRTAGWPRARPRAAGGLPLAFPVLGVYILPTLHMVGDIIKNAKLKE